MKNLKEGDVVFELRHGTANEKHVIVSTNGFLAFSQTKKFEQEYKGLSIRCHSGEMFSGQIFGITYEVASRDTIEKFEKEISIRYIRNTSYQKLSKSKIEEIENFIKFIVAQ